MVSIVHEVERHPGDIHVMLYLLQRLTIRLSDVVVTLSRYVTGSVRSRWPDLPVIQAAHPPFRFEDLAVGPPMPLVMARRPVRLLVVGRMLGYKGIGTAREAFSKLPRGAAQLRIVGDGNAISDGAQDSGAGISVSNRWLSEAELVNEIDAADLVLFPYDEASQSGLVPLCLARGRPVVVTPVGGLAEQVSPAGAGIVLGDNQPESLARAVMPLCADRTALLKMSALALRESDSAAAWRELAERLASAFALGRAAVAPRAEEA